MPGFFSSVTISYLIRGITSPFLIIIILSNNIDDGFSSFLISIKLGLNAQTLIREVVKKVEKSNSKHKKMALLIIRKP